MLFAIRLRHLELELERYSRNVTSESKVIDHGTAGRRLADLDYVEMIAEMELSRAAKARAIPSSI